MIYITYLSTIYSMPNGTYSVDYLMNQIKSGSVKSQVERLRMTIYERHRSQIKKQLPCVLWQGIFKEKADSGVQSLSSLMSIDIDHKSPQELDSYRQRLSCEPWVFGFFISPSADGLKVIVKTDNYDVAAYKSCYRQLEQYFCDNYGIVPDSKCEPLSQGCFMSYDPDLYYNPEASDFPLVYDPTPHEEIPNTGTSTPFEQHELTKVDAFCNQLRAMSSGLSDEQIIIILDRKFSRYSQNYQDGNRTRAVYVQAATLCKAGITPEDAYNYLCSKFNPTGFSQDKVRAQVSSAYMQKQCEFGSERGNYVDYETYKRLKKKRH